MGVVCHVRDRGCKGCAFRLEHLMKQKKLRSWLLMVLLFTGVIASSPALADDTPPKINIPG